MSWNHTHRYDAIHVYSAGFIFFNSLCLANRHIFAPYFSCKANSITSKFQNIMITKNNICHKLNAIKWVVGTSVCICGKEKSTTMENNSVTEFNFQAYMS